MGPAGLLHVLAQVDWGCVIEFASICFVNRLRNLGERQNVLELVMGTVDESVRHQDALLTGDRNC